MPKHILTACIIVALLAGGRDAAAQGAPVPVPITGRVTADDGEVLVGALILLLDNRGQVIGQRITDDVGAFQFTAPSGGSYRIRVEALGRAEWTSPSFVAARGSQPFMFRVATTPIPLDRLQAHVQRRCKSPPESGSSIVALHAALVSAASEIEITESKSNAYGATLQRRLERPQTFDDPRLTYMKTEKTEVRRPLTAPHPDTLVRSGYIIPDPTRVMGHYYVVPTTSVLASASFMQTHCFGVIEQPDSGWIGLTFEPIQGLRNIDVEGVVWFDTVARRPRKLEFSYTRLDDFVRQWIVPEAAERAKRMNGVSQVKYGTFSYRHPREARGFGGVVRYEELPNGCLFTRHWEVVRAFGLGGGWFTSLGFDMHTYVFPAPTLLTVDYIPDAVQSASCRMQSHN